jgi:hypothetical protein
MALAEGRAAASLRRSRLKRCCAGKTKSRVKDPAFCLPPAIP